MIGELHIDAIHDEYDCIKTKLHFWPNGAVGTKNDYFAGELYLRKNEFHNLIDAFKKQKLWYLKIKHIS